MNVHGVLKNAPLVTMKIKLAKKYSKKIDGHAPGLRGSALKKYIGAGISTDHESTGKDEALEKIRMGMNIQIREGSAARNFDGLIPIVDEHYEKCMFCSDDKHPDDLLKGHINELVKRGLKCGIDLFKILKASSVNPVIHYGLDVGLLQRGDSADFLVVDNLNDFNILQTFINGEIVAEKGVSLIKRKPLKIVNNFNTGEKKDADFAIPFKKGKINVIEAIDGELITNRLIMDPKVENGFVVPDLRRDILKIAEVNRYKDAAVAIDFIKNFGIKKGAIASSIAHDSHNILSVGTNDEDICKGVNLIIKHKGGICAVYGDKEMLLPLPIAGLMSNKDYTSVAKGYSSLTKMVRRMGSTLKAPFTTLSFMALSVIPEIKMSDRGLFDSEKFRFIDLFERE